VPAWHDPAVKAFAVFVAVAAVAAGGSSAARQPPVSVPVSIAFFDARHGVMGTERTIETTSNGGRTWTIQYSGTGPYHVLAERGGTRAWATARAQSIHSPNRGVTWRASPRPVSGAVFGAPRFGWDVKQRELPTGRTLAWLSETRDGGRTWRRLARVCGDFEYFGALAHVSRTRGWILCHNQPAAGHQLKAVYATVDGGRRWRMRACACGVVRNRGRISSAGYAGGIEFMRDGFGALIRHRGSGLSITRDGGRTWSAVRVVEFETDYGHDVSVVSRQVVYALVGSPTMVSRRLIVSRDRGRTWRVVRRWPMPG
jgi:photosystem II stability/assembly factor-like uncharacterized protein